MDARAKLERHVRLELLPRLSRDGRAIVIGTPFHPDDLLGVLSRDKQWYSLRHPVFLDDGRTPRWDDPQFSAASIEILRQSMAPGHFDQLYLLRAPEQGAGRFDRAALLRAVEAGRGLTIPVVEWNRTIPCVLGVDPAFATDDRSDMSALVAIGLRPVEGRIVFDLACCQQGRWSADELCSRILSFARRTNATVVCESNAAQRLLEDLLYEKSRAMGIDPPCIERHFTSQATKADRWSGLEAMTGSFMRGEWCIPSDLHTGEPFDESRAFVDALLEYKPSATGAHLPDAVAAGWFAWKSARERMDCGDLPPGFLAR